MEKKNAGLPVETRQNTSFRRTMVYPCRWRGIVLRLDRLNSEKRKWNSPTAIQSKAKERMLDRNSTKERCRRLESLGKMTDSGRALCPDLDTEFTIDTDITNIFHAHPTAWENFRAFHPLYQRVRIDNIQRVKANPRLFSNRLSKLIEASANGKW